MNPDVDVSTHPARGAMATQFGDRYAKAFLAGWGTIDFNGHMANTTYLDLTPTSAWRSSPSIELPISTGSR